MPDIKFNFSNLKNIYSEAWGGNDPTIAFEIREGAGCFVFMMFLSKEDAEQNDRLFVYFRNINTLITIKLYGSHAAGDFMAYIKAREQDLIRQELQLQGGGNPFNLEHFLNTLNNAIPQFLPPTTKTEVLQRTWPSIRTEMRTLVDDAHKTVLIGLKPLPEGKKPKDKTLRKLYLHVNGVTNEIGEFLNVIRSRNITLAWTDDQTRTAKSFAQLLTDFNQKYRNQM
ncbi:hypothetical protein MUA04_01515 [Enterobacteriaceae bacterium H11S18]|uniref:hypothetical protein n=1 Tax=Dryocola clanedunensis TaxID=2925396 RepID=UPI0022F0AB01|nr:hypothetical protein [Dryocola clanedunensis]MCT4708899.1 hypothetical protein [Dryocola clanedunensis]